MASYDAPPEAAGPTYYRNYPRYDALAGSAFGTTPSKAYQSRNRTSGGYL